jgi:hypothetical protein
MPKTLQVGNEIFKYPVLQDGIWGEEATAWAEAVTDALQNVQGPNDILPTSSTLNNNQTTFQDIPGLAFDVSDVLTVTISYFVERIYDTGTTTVTENGEVSANFDGTAWKFVHEHTGDAGMLFNITAAGQVQYKTTDLANHTSSSIRFRAKTIDKP